MKNLTIAATPIATLETVPTFADHLADKAYAKGAMESGGVAHQAEENGTQHPGHVAVGASGQYNKPAADYHLDGTQYDSGTGGYAKTKRNENANQVGSGVLAYPPQGSISTDNFCRTIRTRLVSDGGCGF